MDGKTFSQRVVTGLTTIDFTKDYPHIVKLGTKYNQSPDYLKNQIKSHQQQHQTHVLEELGQTFPILKKYNKLTKERLQSRGFKKEQLDKSLRILVKDIVQNNELIAALSFHNLKIKMFEHERIKVL